MKPYLRKIDHETLGNRCDVTPIFSDRECFSLLVEDLAAPFLDEDIHLVACIDALGFILGTAIADRLSVGVLPLRKGGKLPVRTVSEFFTDYSGEEKSLEIRKGALSPGARVLLVDEWIETGAQVGAATKLLESQGGIVVGIASINMDSNDFTDKIRGKYLVHTVREGE